MLFRSMTSHEIEDRLQAVRAGLLWAKCVEEPSHKVICEISNRFPKFAAFWSGGYVVLYDPLLWPGH